VPSALNALQLVGWTTFELLVMALAAAVLSGYPLGPLTPFVFVPVFGGVVLLLALAGPLAVVRAWLERFAIWAVFASTAAIALLLAFSGHDLSSAPDTTAMRTPGSVMLALDLVIVMPISWWPLVSDYNRFAASSRASTLGTVGGLTGANAAFFILGGALVIFAFSASPTAGYHDFLLGLSLLQLGALPLLIILVDETDNAFADVYSTAVSVQNLAPKWGQARLIVAATGLAAAGALYLVYLNEGIGGAYNQFLILIGGVFVPLLGVVIADAFVVRRAGYRADEFGAGASPVNGAAFAAWVPASLLYYAIFAGWIAGFPPVGATLPAFALAAGLHILFSKLRKRTSGIAVESAEETAV
jgi:putative hydroxymethylpyrimidine transporter CytX